MDLQLQDQFLLISGGAGGLGTSVTQMALRQGAHVTVPYRKAQEAERLQASLSAAEQARLSLCQSNLTDEASVSQLVSQLPRLDALMHLVGGFSMGPTPELSYADWQGAFELNLNTAFLLCKHSLKRMQAQNYGRIVTIGSRGAVEPVGQLAAYCAAKAGVVALTRAIADEMKGTQITANVVLPSIIDTAANRQAMGSENADQWVKPESLAGVICFLASPAAADLRGAVVPVFGNA
jgi:NAD(P)-dependent dehydrogenase (short-subunit alcohol dehydrogenase family)